MKGLRIGFIGGGRIVRIILGGWEKSGILPLLDIIVSDTSEETLQALKRRFPGIQILPGRNPEAALGDIVFLALHPPAAGEVLSAIRPNIRDDAILVSLMPKITIAQMSAKLGGFSRIARTIPNAPSIIGQGYNPFAFSAGIAADERALLTPLFSALGNCPEVPEEHLEAYAVITAMGPTYLWFQMDELENIAQTFGISRQAAKNSVEQMALGAIRTMFSSGMKPEEVMDLVPVKPLGEDEPEVRAMYREKLTALHNKLKG